MLNFTLLQKYLTLSLIRILGDSLPSAGSACAKFPVKLFPISSTVAVGCTPGLLPRSMYHFNKLLGLEPEKQCAVTQLLGNNLYCTTTLNVCVEGSSLAQGSMIPPFALRVLGM